MYLSILFRYQFVEPFFSQNTRGFFSTDHAVFGKLWEHLTYVNQQLSSSAKRSTGLSSFWVEMALSDQIWRVILLILALIFFQYRSKKPVIIGIRRPSLDLLFFDGNALHTWIYEPLTRVQLDYVCSSWRRYANFLGGIRTNDRKLNFLQSIYTSFIVMYVFHWQSKLKHL